MAITTATVVKQYLKITGADDDALISALIDRSTAAIETFCQRTFASANYTTWLDGKGGQYLWLPNYPITAVTRASVGTRDAMTIKNATTDATYAKVQTTTSTLSYAIVGGTSAATGTLAYGTYTTITLLVAAVNALGSQWIASVQGTYGTAASADLKPIGPVNCLNETITLPIPELPASDLQYDSTNGQLYRPGGFTAGYKNIYVEYTAGYSTYPDDLIQACIDLTAQLYRNIRRDDRLQSESLGDYSYATRAQVDIDNKMAARLFPFRRMTLSGE